MEGFVQDKPYPLYFLPGPKHAKVSLQCTGTNPEFYIFKASFLAVLGGNGGAPHAEHALSAPDPHTAVLGLVPVLVGVWELFTSEFPTPLTQDTRCCHLELRRVCDTAQDPALCLEVQELLRARSMLGGHVCTVT